MENDKTMFDEIVRTEIKPDGTVEASLVENSTQEMEAAAADMVKAWKDFKDANGDQYPIAVWTYNWWKALVYLALAEDHLKEQFLGRDRTPSHIASIRLAILLLWLGVAFHISRSTHWRAMRLRESMWITLQPERSSMQPPPAPCETQRRIGEDREQRPGGWRGTEKEDHQELGDVAEEQRTEHPPCGSDAGVQQPAVRLTPPMHGFRPLTPRRGAELRIDQHQEAATPRPSPKEKLSAVRRAAQPERREGQSRREWHENGEDQQRL